MVAHIEEEVKSGSSHGYIVASKEKVEEVTQLLMKSQIHGF